MKEPTQTTADFIDSKQAGEYMKTQLANNELMKNLRTDKNEKRNY